MFVKSSVQEAGMTRPLRRIKRKGQEEAAKMKAEWGVYGWGGDDTAGITAFSTEWVGLGVYG